MASADKEFLFEVRESDITPLFILTEDLSRAISTEEPIPLEIELDTN